LCSMCSICVCFHVHVLSCMVEINVPLPCHSVMYMCLCLLCYLCVVCVYVCAVLCDSVDPSALCVLFCYRRLSLSTVCVCVLLCVSVCVCAPVCLFAQVTLSFRANATP